MQKPLQPGIPKMEMCTCLQHASEETTALQHIPTADLAQSLASLLAKGVKLSVAASAFGLDIDSAANLAVSASSGVVDEPPPHELVCPITMELFSEPVVATDGFTYERSAIEKHLLFNATSPKTNAKLMASGAVPAKALVATQTVKTLVIDWLEDRAVIAKHALKRHIDGGDIEAAQEVVNTCEAWTPRFPLKLRLAFLRMALRIPLHGDDFRKRECEFLSAAQEAGQDLGEAFLEHHQLSFGYCRYGYYVIYGVNDKLGDSWGIPSDSPIITTLLPACSSVLTFVFTFGFKKVRSEYQQLPDLTSCDFKVDGIGTCYISLFGEWELGEEVLRASLIVRTPLPEAELHPVLVSLRRKGDAQMFFWRECGRRSNDAAYDVRVLDLSTQRDRPVSLILELVVRSLNGPTIAVPSLPESELSVEVSR